MSALSEYNPLKSIQVPGAEIANPEGVIVVIGPNSSGKTLFLRDIEQYLVTGKPELIVCQSITPRKPDDLQAFADDLIKHRYLQVNAQKVYQVYIPFLRPKTQRTTFALNQLEKAYKDFLPDPNGRNDGFFGAIGLTLVAPLSLDERREVCQKAPGFPYKTNAPELPIQGLYLSSTAQEQLACETGMVFGNAVWLDISENNALQLRVAGSRERPPVGRMNNPIEASKYRPIETEGDGYKSYVGICLSLLQGIRPVSLIDEPELCLHPPQAYHVGRFIGRYAEDKHVTFVATHSSHVLRGILETGRTITVIRLTRRETGFHGHLISNDDLRAVLHNPRAKAEAVLDGAFSKGVVIVESDGDREEYLAASEAVADYPAREVHIVPVGGTGGFAEACRFCRSLEIPVAVVADLDAVCDTKSAEATICALEPNQNEVDEVTSKLREVVQRIKELPPLITKEDVKAELKQLSETPLEWSGGGDDVLRRELNDLSNRIKRLRRLKEGGIEAYKDSPEIHRLLRSLVERCTRFGLFLVPGGELEDWVKGLMQDWDRNRASKTKRAAVAAERIRSADVKEGDIWAFMKSVLDYLWREREMVRESE